MASEDVLEMLEVFSRKHVDYRNEESAWQEISAIVYALAAEVRELRKNQNDAWLDGKRSAIAEVLKGLRSERNTTQLRAIIASVEWMAVDIDAAMGGEG